MKKYILTLLLLGAVNFAAICQPLPNGDPGGPGDTPVGGTAPIENGVFILLIFAIAYILYKQKKKVKLKEEMNLI